MTQMSLPNSCFYFPSAEKPDQIPKCPWYVHDHGMLHPNRLPKKGIYFPHCGTSLAIKRFEQPNDAEDDTPVRMAEIRFELILEQVIDDLE
jgi:hypothetical protein